MFPSHKASVTLAGMKVVALYRPQSDHARTVEDFARDLERRNKSSRVELISIDTRDGAATASLYDVVRYPAFLALQNDGQLLKDWQVPPMPQLNEISYYSSTW